MASSSHKLRSHSCFNEWIHLQEKDLNELTHALTLNTNVNVNSKDTNTQLAQKSIRHFEEYMDKRSKLYHEEASPFFAPTWCSSLENSTLWMGGCRPSKFFRLLYAHTSSNVESVVAQLMQEGTNSCRESSSSSSCCCCDISSKQLVMVNNLHIKTIKEEDKMTTKWASLHEDLADKPIFEVANRLCRIGETNGEVELALDEHDSAMAAILDEADKFRLSTVKELLSILKPEQAVDFLAAGKRLHLNIHEWGKRRDNKHGM